MCCVGSQPADGTAYLATDSRSGWMKHLVGNLPIVHGGKPCDSKFVTLLALCLKREPSCDSAQVFLF